MNSIWNEIHFTEIPIPIIALITIGVIGVIASGKVADVFRRSFACLVSYCLAIVYGPNLFAQSPKMLTSLDSIPFFYSLVQFQQPGIISLFSEDISAFSCELLKLLLLAMMVDLFLSIAQPLFQWCASIKFYGLGLLSSWIARYAICSFAMFAYVGLYVMVLNELPNKLWILMSFFVIIITILMLATPLIQFILLWADIIPNPIVKSVSAFVKEHQMGGVLQVSFFSAFLLLVFFVCLQEAAPEIFNNEIVEQMKQILQTL